MAYVDATIDSFLPTFFEAWPFHHLADPQRKQVISKLRLCSFYPGELIYPSRELPSLIHCVLQERVRILGPTSYQSPTLAVVGAGTVIGWDSLLRRISSGSVRAAITSPDSEQNVLTLALPADDFESLALQHLMSILAQRASLTELFDTLSRFLSRMPTPVTDTNLRDIVQCIEQKQLAVVKNWNPKSKNDSLELSADRIWLVSGGASLTIPIGTPIGSVEQLIADSPPDVVSMFPLRLLGIDRAFLSAAVLSGAIPPPEIVETTLEANTTLQLGSSRLDSSQLDSLQMDSSNSVASNEDSFSVPTALRPTEKASSTAPSSLSSSKSYPIWRSNSSDPIDDIVACFGMICDRLQVPYRPDSLRRLLTQKPIDKFDPVDLYLRIAQAIGLNAELVRFNPTPGGINRLSTPALLQCRDVVAVLHDVTPTMTVLGSPRTGLLRLSPSQLASYLIPKHSSIVDKSTLTCDAIVLERLPNTPIKHFGFNWFIPVLIKQRGILIQVLFASVFVQLLGLANPLLVQQVIDKVIVAANLGAMATFGMLMIVFAVLEGVLTILRTHLFASTTNRIDLRLGTEIIHHLLRLPLNFFEKRPVGELSSRLSELENIRQFLTGTALTAVLDVIFSVFYIAVMFLYSVRLTTCVLLTIPIVIASTLLISTIQRKLIRIKSDHGSKVQSYLVEVLSGIFTVKAQHMESLVESTWRERYTQYLTSGFTISTVGTIFSSFSNFINAMSSLLVLWVGAGLVLEGKLTLGGLIAFRILTGYVTGPLLRLARLWQRFQETSLSMELLADIVEFPTEALPHDQTHLAMPLIRGHVQYHDVSFAFKAGQLQLMNVNLDIPPGSFVGVVGQSGSGKSTLMKLLPRLYVPQTGRICIDGYDISKVNLNSLREQIGIVPQDAVLFEGTIRDNIALFGEMSDEDVIAAAKVADAHDFIMRLPDTYNTQVGERGASLSGGQRQRIAIARVVARNPQLLIFDEATSALDYETERRVCENLMQRFHDRTVFFITHRLNTIIHTDWILFMQSGVLVEQGTHQDLMALRQLYYCLYTQQSRI